jgi:hypothetical protein
MYSSQASVTNSFNSNSTITIPFIETALEDNAALLVSIDYTGTNGGGHEILVNGLQWNGTDSGTLYFVDPLDPSQQYNGTNVLGPTLQTESESFTKTNGELLLTYSQLHDNNLTNSPPNPADDTIIAQAYVRGGLSLTVVPEPSTYALLALGALFLIIALSRRSSPLTPRVE